MNNTAYDYVAQEVESADPARMIELLYQRALRDLKNAVELWPTLDRSPAAIQLLVHAQAILTELQLSLNYKDGGQLAETLGQLYEYMQFRIVEITTRRAADESQSIEEIIGLLSSLSDAWSIMSRERVEAGHASELLRDGELVA